MVESVSSPSEVERQLTAAAERHRELIAAVAVADRPEQGRHAAAAALARGVQLMSFTLARAAAAGIAPERLVELSGWDASVIEDLLAKGPEPSVITRLAPAHVDATAVSQAAASFEASARVDAAVQAIMADVEDRSWSPAAADLDDLAERLEHAWRAWRQALTRRGG
jgi:hypothetical protein